MPADQLCELGDLLFGQRPGIEEGVMVLGPPPLIKTVVKEQIHYGCRGPRQRIVRR